MRKLAQDFSTHPLLPGAVLACLIQNQSPTNSPAFGVNELNAFNKCALPDLISQFQAANALPDECAGKVIQADGQFLAAFRQLEKRLSEVAEVTGCDKLAASRLARALFSAQLLAEYLELLTPPQISYEKTAKGTVDLIQALTGSFRQIAGGAWSVFFPRTEFSLIADASGQFWVACLYAAKPEEMAGGFIGLFNRAHADRLRTLNPGVSGGRRLSLQDQLAGYLENAPVKFAKLHDAVEEHVKTGLDRAFSEILRVCAKLQLPPLVPFYYEFLVQEVCASFATLDGTVSAKENRFNQYFLQQISAQCEEHLKTSFRPASQSEQEKLDAVLAELEELVGLAGVKEKVRQTANFARLQQLRLAQGLKPIATSYHSVYVGNPGTGKTTVARLMGRIFSSLGVLRRGHVVECDRAALVGEYLGQTAPKTNAIIDSALDGILFIDEAYSLAKEQDEYGREAVEILLKRMEDERGRLIVIVAGYPAEMTHFINSNPGLHSRFTRFVEFADYSPAELCRIFSSMCRRNGLTLTPELKENVLHHFTWLHAQRGGNFGNARLVRNCFEAVINAQATRLANSGATDAESLTKLEADDLESPSAGDRKQHLQTGKGYLVRCEQCGQAYRWSPELDLLVAHCTACGKNYHGEFGELVS